MRTSKLAYLIGIMFLLLLILVNVQTSYASDPTLSIPSIDMHVPIQTAHIIQAPSGELIWDVANLHDAAAYLEGTAWFGTGGNTVLGGHSMHNGQRDAFYSLESVEVNDEVIVTLEGQTLRFVVTQVFEVDERDTSILNPSGQEQLTVLACDLDSLDPATGKFTRRLVVVAVRVS